MKPIKTFLIVAPALLIRNILTMNLLCLYLIQAVLVVDIPPDC